MSDDSCCRYFVQIAILEVLLAWIKKHVVVKISVASVSSKEILLCIHIPILWQEKRMNSFTTYNIYKYEISLSMNILLCYPYHVSWSKSAQKHSQHFVILPVAMKSVMYWRQVHDFNSSHHIHPVKHVLYSSGIELLVCNDFSLLILRRRLIEFGTTHKRYVHIHSVAPLVKRLIRLLGKSFFYASSYNLPSPICVHTIQMLCHNRQLQSNEYTKGMCGMSTIILNCPAAV